MTHSIKFNTCIYKYTIYPDVIIFTYLRPHILPPMVTMIIVDSQRRLFPRQRARSCRIIYLNKWGNPLDEANPVCEMFELINQLRPQLRPLRYRLHSRSFRVNFPARYFRCAFSSHVFRMCFSLPSFRFVHTEVFAIIRCPLIRGTDLRRCGTVTPSLEWHRVRGIFPPI